MEENYLTQIMTQVSTSDGGNLLVTTFSPQWLKVSQHALNQFTMFQSLLKLLHIINQNICQIKFPFQKELHLD